MGHSDLKFEESCLSSSQRLTLYVVKIFNIYREIEAVLFFYSVR